MGKKLNEIQTFFIDSNKEKLTVIELAKKIGCTERTIYNYINKNKGLARTEEGRDSLKGGPIPSENAEPQETPKEKPLPPPGMHLLGRRKHGNGAAVTMTPEMSEVTDQIMSKGGNTNSADYLHIINPNKED